MKKKVIVSVVIFTLLLISVACVNSYAQTFSKEGRWQVKREIGGQRVEENQGKEVNPIYKNREERITSCDNVCEQKENCPIYQQNDNGIQPNNQCLQQNNNHRRNCSSRQNCHNKMCKK